MASSAGLVLWGNVVVPRLPQGPVARAAANVAGTAFFVGAARRRGYGWRELGLSPGTWTAGARLGGTAAGAVAGAFALLLATPPGREVLAAGRGDQVAAWRPTALRAGLTIPVGTVLAEEIAFRGVLQAMAERRLAPRTALSWCAGTFSLWHVAGRSTGGPADLAVTGLAGVVFGLMRRRSGTVVAPALLHLATNSGGLVVATIAGRRAKARSADYAGGIASTGRASTTVS
ncbi:MAG TPA: CPBP family intramembrane glutamic endopeptidase [Actinomycetales bacterium]|nr:CPBP family intramembrane glutamic endopeptidase [Actinomycetales bacterium]